jgi:hypothetical protein
MAMPLRKEHPEFDDEKEITTADLAQGKRPASETQAVQTEQAERTSPPPSSSDHSLENERRSTGSAALFPGGELEGLRARWKEIQTAFVDQPRKAVEEADGLVASAMKRLAEVFADERSGLEQQWDRGGDVSTEDLRVALQMYRSFFDRLLSV